MAVELQEARPASVNLLGLTRGEYRGLPSTLCAGCGHNSISNQIIAACYEMSVPPWKTIKLSGIGCSSKSPAYFLNRSHGFNGLHGRMPSLATGALVANRGLRGIGVSGDGDTASIGIGQFIHMLRRNIPMVYIVENNGVYGLTKGQFSATADKGQVLKKGVENPFSPVDICIEALAANCGFVARSFAGDPRQVKELIKAALGYNGTAVLDIISPCVTFNNRDESTKSYAWGKEHEDPIHDMSVIPEREEIHVDYEPGQSTTVEMHDGSRLVLKKLEREYNPRDRMAALRLLEQSRVHNELITGLLYLNDEQPILQDIAGLVDTPIAALPPEALRPSRESLEKLLAEFR
ncbi:MAG: 2-oxoacid:ferredoxin oxidoreductase subunit beta [Anaerolineales bacterium]|nr:2-oxoacid:ferredoxin oxidoreductase subunit beta [Anaerolineales bacterium]